MPANQAQEAEVLLAIRQRLVDKHVFEDENALISLEMLGGVPIPIAPGEVYCIVFPITQPFARQSDGAGRYGSQVRGRMNVYIRNQIGTDRELHDRDWLLDCERGSLPKSQKVYDALQMFLPLSDDGTRALLAEPMRCVFSGEPKKKWKNRHAGDRLLEFEVLYSLSLTTDQGDV